MMNSHIADASGVSITRVGYTQDDKSGKLAADGTAKSARAQTPPTCNGHYEDAPAANETSRPKDREGERLTAYLPSDHSSGEQPADAATIGGFS